MGYFSAESSGCNPENPQRFGIAYGSGSLRKLVRMMLTWRKLMKDGNTLTEQRYLEEVDYIVTRERIRRLTENDRH